MAHVSKRERRKADLFFEKRRKSIQFQNIPGAVNHCRLTH